MRKKISDIPMYDLKNFRKIHRQDDSLSSFGHNQLDPAKAIDGFQLYSTEAVIGTAGPLKSAFYRIGITVTGSLDMQIGLDHYKHQPSTLSFTFPNQIFSKKNISKETWGYYLFFTATFISEVVPAIKIPDEFPFFNAFGTPVFQVNTDELDNILSLIMRMNDELQAARTGREKAIQLYLYLLLLEAKRSYERQHIDNPDKHHSAHYKLANRFRKLVAQHYLTKRQVSDYAQMLGVSANHLNKTVKANTGQTASDAIREMVLQEAQALLLYTNSSISEIAYHLAFSAPASFNRFFKITTGVTPLSFREKHK